MRQYGGGTVIGLCDAIREAVEEATETLRLDTDIMDDPARAPRIVNGYLPPKRSGDEPDHPFVIVRPNGGLIQTAETYRARVSIIVGTYSEDYDDGHEDALIVMERIVKALCERPTLQKRYRLEYPLEWFNFDDQPYPYAQVEARTEWSIPVPVLLPDEGVM